MMSAITELKSGGWLSWAGRPPSSCWSRAAESSIAAVEPRSSLWLGDFACSTVESCISFPLDRLDTTCLGLTRLGGGRGEWSKDVGSRRRLFRKLLPAVSAEHSSAWSVGAAPDLFPDHQVKHDCQLLNTR